MLANLRSLPDTVLGGVTVHVLVDVKLNLAVVLSIAVSVAVVRAVLKIRRSRRAPPAKERRRGKPSHA